MTFSRTDEPATTITITHDSNNGNAMMANCYYANKLHGGYCTVENKLSAAINANERLSATSTLLRCAAADACCAAADDFT
ncbi:uncharacterized protein LOC122756432 [Drosophila santomea]|uniref:uncharacterized protein LOC122756432 n=1 Tax=Drosophila santomea TaxID=129105 RepID=UPI001CC9CA5E|nr:uncharacterized protein LOC122756432 [Drosophila santomea]